MKKKFRYKNVKKNRKIHENILIIVIEKFPQFKKFIMHITALSANITDKVRRNKLKQTVL